MKQNQTRTARVGFGSCHESQRLARAASGELEAGDDAGNDGALCGKVTGHSVFRKVATRTSIGFWCTWSNECTRTASDCRTRTNNFSDGNLSSVLAA